MIRINMTPDFFETLLDTWITTDTIAVFMISLCLIFILYITANINQRLRLLQSEIAELQKDQHVMSEELEIVVSNTQASSVERPPMKRQATDQ